jgi:hypothetical protein
MSNKGKAFKQIKQQGPPAITAPELAGYVSGLANLELKRRRRERFLYAWMGTVTVVLLLLAVL